jgi:hypothetical protein
MAQRTRRELRKSKGSEAQLLDQELDKIYAGGARGGTIHGTTPIYVSGGVASLTTSATPYATGFPNGCFGVSYALVSPATPAAHPDVMCTPLTNGNFSAGSSPTAVIISWTAVGY